MNDLSRPKGGEGVVSEHTKGEWVIDEVEVVVGGLVCIYIAKKDDGRVANVFCNCLVKDKECWANARLIAAAPELLKVVRLLDRNGVASPMVLRMAEEALRKVRGAA